MTFTHRFPLPLIHGLHARPASVLQVEASAYDAEIEIVNERNGRPANAKSVLSLVGADIHHGDPCLLTVAGAEAERAFAALKFFVTDVLPKCDEPLPAPEAEGGAAIVPRVLTASGEVFHRGAPASPGIGIGEVFLAGGLALPEDARRAESPDEEEARFQQALTRTVASIEGQLLHARDATERDILQAHLGIARDPEFAARVREGVGADHASAGQAVMEAERHYAGLLLASESAYLRERAVDVRDIAEQLLRAMYGTAGPEPQPPAAPFVCVAESLAPSRFLALDRTHLKGLVIADAGTTSHTVILARAAGVPCVTGVRDIHRLLAPGQNALVDGHRGLVVPCPSEPVARYYDLERRRDARRAEQLSRYVTEEARTADGRRLEVAANAATPEEAEAAFARGAEGIGLFRTEMLFLDRDAPPSEEEQYEAYARAVRAAAGRSVIFRTLDIGGDKPAPYLDLPAESNPFLGYRAIRFYPEHAELIAAQMRAILRAAALGPVRVMFPMVCCVEEVRALKERLESVRAGLEGGGVAHGPVEVGIMVETPAAALAADALAAEVDFFSIGTNDLLQYTLAVDRGHPKLSGLYSPLHPAFLRLLRDVVAAAHAKDRFVGLCGEMGGSEALAPVLVGLGLDEVSLAGPGVLGMKAAIAAQDAAACRALVDEMVAQPDRAGVSAALERFASASGAQSVLAPEITELHSTARSRAEVIKEMVDRLALAGRVRDPNVVEEAVWLREDVYSTGVGFGIAIPHCKTAAVTANSVGLLRLAEPVEWNTLDGEPVRMAIMLAIRDADQGDEHLRLFARLARKIIHEDFRERLLSEPDPEALIGYIAQAISE